MQPIDIRDHNIRTGFAKSGDLEIYYEDMGDIGAPPVLLIMGLGAQLVLWPEGFCQDLVDRGLRVIRFDNRDIGLSSKLDGQRTPGSQYTSMARSLVGRPSPAVYTLEDMADDAAAVLTHLGIERAHIVGASMGGMIAQVVASRHPERTATLGVIFSSNNQAALPPPDPRALFAVIKGPPPDAPREVIIDNAVRVARIIGSPAYPKPEEQLRAEAATGYDRSHYPVGVARQFGAILGSGSLRQHNRRTSAPTVVIHGRADRLMRPTGGKAVANNIEGARLVLIPGMGHDLPEQLWTPVTDQLDRTFSQVTL